MGYSPWGHKALGTTWPLNNNNNNSPLWWSNLTQFSPSHSVMSDSATPCSMPGLPVHHHLQELLKLMSIESVMPSHHLILCHPLLFLPSIFPSKRIFSNESVLRIRWPKYWSFSFSISPSNEYSGLNSFCMDWLDLPAVQGTLKSLLQHHSSKASILQHYESHTLGKYYCGGLRCCS